MLFYVSSNPKLATLPTSKVGLAVASIYSLKKRKQEETLEETSTNKRHQPQHISAPNRSEEMQKFWSNTIGSAEIVKKPANAVVPKTTNTNTTKDPQLVLGSLEATQTGKALK